MYLQFSADERHSLEEEGFVVNAALDLAAYQYNDNSGQHQKYTVCHHSESGWQWQLIADGRPLAYYSNFHAMLVGWEQEKIRRNASLKRVGYENEPIIVRKGSKTLEHVRKRIEVQQERQKGFLLEWAQAYRPLKFSDPPYDDRKLYKRTVKRTELALQEIQGELYALQDVELLLMREMEG